MIYTLYIYIIHYTIYYIIFINIYIIYHTISIFGSALCTLIVYAEKRRCLYQLIVCGVRENHVCTADICRRIWVCFVAARVRQNLSDRFFWSLLHKVYVAVTHCLIWCYIAFVVDLPSKWWRSEPRYPLEYIPNAKLPAVGGHPKNIIMCLVSYFSASVHLWMGFEAIRTLDPVLF